MANINYSFGAGGFKLGQRVEVKTTKQRGLLVSEAIHLSGCNTYQVLLPRVIRDEKMTIKNCDYLILRKLESHESVFTSEDNLTVDNTFTPDDKTINVDLIKSAILNGYVTIPQVDDAIGIEEITIMPGTEVFHRVYGKPMVLIVIIRNIYSKEHEYGLLYVENEKEYTIFDCGKALLPMEQLIDIHMDEDGKKGLIFDDMRPTIGKRQSYEGLITQKSANMKG